LTEETEVAVRVNSVATTSSPEPFGPPNGLGAQQSSAALERRSTFDRDRGLLHSVAGETGDSGASDAVWQLHVFTEVTSTNLVAAKLPAWHAVRADTQTAGRGRFQRSWVSDAGGLWLSAVLPVKTNSPAWRMLPLATGLAVCDALRACGVKALRLRWPNDVLVGDRKLAGLLIDQFQPGLAVVGIGINVCNNPETRDAALRDHVVRLADMVARPPTLRGLAENILTALRAVWEELHRVSDSGEQRAGRRSFPTLLPRINALWDLPRRVQLDLDGELMRGEFIGVDAGGRLRLRLAGNVTRFFEPQDVKLLRDLE